jgi:hypothetical protein
LGISGLDPHILAFSTPENAPTEISLGLKKLGGGGGGGHKNHPKKKMRALPFVLARWRQKKIGAEQEKVAQVILDSAQLGPSEPLTNETSLDFRPGASPFASCFFGGVISDPGQSSPDVGRFPTL